MLTRLERVTEYYLISQNIQEHLTTLLPSQAVNNQNYPTDESWWQHHDLSLNVAKTPYFALMKTCHLLLCVLLPNMSLDYETETNF